MPPGAAIDGPALTATPSNEHSTAAVLVVGAVRVG
jgi:hypothetical protein